MCCIAEIAMLVFGVIILAKGQCPFFGNKVVTGIPAYLIGIILAGTLPVLFAIGLVIGFMVVAQGGALADLPEWVSNIDLAVVPCVLLVVMVIALTTAKEPSLTQQPQQPPMGTLPEFAPPDPNNPYASPSMPNPRFPETPFSEPPDDLPPDDPPPDNPYGPSR